MEGANNFNLNMASFADTGQWRLIITVSVYGISSILKNVMDHDIEPVLLFSKPWKGNESNLLQLVEEAVYDNPRILDDFATQIIVYTHKSLWIPEDLTDEEEYDTNFFTSVYDVNTDDIFADFDDEEVCLYTLAPGLNSFFQRTLPGCKVSSHLSIIKSKFKELEKTSADPIKDCIYINCRDTDVDFFAFSDGRFLSGSSHRWKALNDIAYRLLFMCKVYNLDLAHTRIIIIANHSLSEGLMENIKSFFPFVSVKQLPAVSEKYHLPLAAALAAGENFV